MKKRKIIAPLLMITLLTGCAKDSYATPKAATNTFIESIQNYDYTAYSKAISKDLLDSMTFVVDTENDKDNVILYGQPIDGDEFKKMYQSILGDIIIDYKFEKAEEIKEETDKSSETDNDNDSEETKDSDSTDTSKSTEKSDDDSSKTADKQYKVTGKLTIAKADSFGDATIKTFNSQIESIFKEAPKTQEEATKSMIKFFADSYKKVYSEAEKEDVDVEFTLSLNSETNTYSIVSSDIFDTLLKVYESVNEQLSASDLYYNENAYTAYLLISLGDDGYKEYLEGDSKDEVDTDGTAGSETTE